MVGAHIIGAFDGAFDPFEVAFANFFVGHIAPHLAKVCGDGKTTFFNAVGNGVKHVVVHLIDHFAMGGTQFNKFDAEFIQNIETFIQVPCGAGFVVYACYAHGGFFLRCHVFFLTYWANVAF